MSAKVSVRTVPSLAGRGVQQDHAAHVSLSSIFNFQRTDIADAVSWAYPLVASARSSVAHAALLIFFEGSFRSELLRRQRRAALVGEAYIVRAPSNCQRRNRTFLNFLRQWPANAYRSNESRARTRRAPRPSLIHATLETDVSSRSARGLVNHSRPKTGRIDPCFTFDPTHWTPVR